MKTKISLALILILTVFLPQAFAHGLWVNALSPENGMVRADIGYGHEFPKAAPIAADRLHILKPLVLVTPEGQVEMVQSGENYAYRKEMALKKQTLMVLGFYRPTFWSKGASGWSQTDRIQRPDADYVEEAVMYGKTILNIKGAREDALIKKPVGMRLEIVPLVNPATVKAGEKFPMQVLCDGKPARVVAVDGCFAGFSDKGYMAFHGETDVRGMIDFIPLKPGYWIVKVEQTIEYEDKTRADEVVLSSSLTFTIPE